MNTSKLPVALIPAKTSIPTHGIIALLLFLCMSLTTNAGAAGLTLDQIAAATRLASQTNWQDSSVRRSQASHPLGRQILSIEKQEDKLSRKTRFVRVYEFDYAHMAARLLVVDLLDMSIQREQALATVHLPLNQSEIDFAIARVAEDDAFLHDLRREQSLRGGTVFTSLSELDVKASIYEPGPNGQAAITQDCQMQRCALLSLFDHTRTVFSLEPVVNLGTMQLMRLTQP